MMSGAVLLATVAGPSFADIDFAKAEKMRASGEAISTEKVVEIASKAHPARRRQRAGGALRGACRS